MDSSPDMQNDDFISLYAYILLEWSNQGNLDGQDV
jgi:hypothetical protein